MGKHFRSSSLSISSSSNNNTNSTASSFQHLHADLRLGLSISPPTHHPISSLFVKVYMEGIPIGRKLDVLAHDGYSDLVKTLEHMFDTTILLGTEMEGVVLQAAERRVHVLTYEDEEGDLIMVGDIPWEMFLTTVKRLKITRVDAFGC